MGVEVGTSVGVGVWVGEGSKVGGAGGAASGSAVGALATEAMGTVACVGNPSWEGGGRRRAITGNITAARPSTEAQAIRARARRAMGDSSALLASAGRLFIYSTKSASGQNRPSLLTTRAGRRRRR